MKHRTNRAGWVWTLVLASSVAVSCGDGVQAPDAEAIEQALEEIADELGLAEDGNLGKLDASDEEPAFGNRVFARAFDDRDERTGNADDRADDDVVVFDLLVAWGRIRPNTDTRPIGIRWNPMISVMEGDGIRVQRTLRFERGDAVLPQRVPHAVMIRSATRLGVDGVVLRVVFGREGGPNAFLRFESDPIAVNVPARELGELNEFHMVDSAGNGLMLVAVERPPADCPHGFMGGRWARTSDLGGVFGGVWRQANGERNGFLAGRWGVTSDGEQVFNGKVINNRGQFLAFMAGNYGGGAYEGELLDRDGNLLGFVRGHYAAADEGGHGQFRGVWQQVCESGNREVCDGEDNDSDGRIDEGVTNACGECGTVPEEVCDGEDNDCDNAIDEGVSNACGTCGAVPEEVCDGEDNDCDNAIDEGVTNACGTCGGVPIERCDGIDNDCDNAVDEGVTNACGTCGAVPIERCDGIDNDCDNAVDEGACLISGP